MEYRKSAFKIVHKPLLWQQNTLNHNFFVNEIVNLLRTILNYVKSQHVSYSTSMFEEKDWDISAPTDLNLGKNSYDCGVYVCMYSFMVCNGCFFDRNNLDSNQ